MPGPKEDTSAILERVTPGYFEATGIHIVQGRALEAAKIRQRGSQGGSGQSRLRGALFSP